MLDHYATIVLMMLFGDMETESMSSQVPARSEVTRPGVRPGLGARVRPGLRPTPATLTSTGESVAKMHLRDSAAQGKSSKTRAATAEEAVVRVQAFYNTTQSFSANFTQTVTNQTFNKLKPKVSKGKVYILKPGKMRFDYNNLTYKSTRDLKVSKSFISDGEHLWAVMHKNKVFYTQNLVDSALPTAVRFLMGTGDLRKEFNASFDTPGTYGTKEDLLLLLTPKVPSARYKKLWLVIDKKNFSVKESVVLNIKNDTNSIRFDSVLLNEKNLSGRHFLFNAKAHPEYRKITPP